MTGGEAATTPRHATMCSFMRQRPRDRRRTIPNLLSRRRAQACLRPLGIVDALRAFHALPAARETTAQRDLVLALLELEWRQPAEPSPPRTTDQPPGPPAEPPPTRVPAPPQAPPTVTPPPVEQVLTDRRVPDDVEVIEPVGYVPAVAPDQLFQEVEELPRYDREQHGGAPAPAEPLLPATRQRALLSALGSTWRPGREIRIDRLAALLAEGRPVSRLPRHAIRAISWRIQLLLDLSEGLMPFRRDQDDLVAAFARVAGREAIEVLYFVGCPSGGLVRRAREPWQRYVYPLAGTPIVVVSDLGHSPAPAASLSRRDAAWSEFALDCQKRACPVAVLNPYARHRWPRSVDRALHVLEWDLRLSVGEALRPVMALRERHRSPS